jgi:hypothetical protein
MFGADRIGLTTTVLAPVIWSVHFLFLYVLNALACARGIGAGWVPAGAVFGTLAALAAVGILTFGSWQHARRGHQAAEPFLSRLGLLLGGLTLLSILYNVVPVLLVPACSGVSAG